MAHVVQPVLPFSPPPPPPPSKTIADLEILAVSCKDGVSGRTGRGRGTTLDAISLSQLVVLADKHGVPAVDAALRESGGTERPVAHARTILEPKAARRASRATATRQPSSAGIAEAWDGAAAPAVPDLEDE